MPRTPRNRPTALQSAKPSAADYAKAAQRVVVKPVPKKPQNARQAKFTATEQARADAIAQADWDAKHPEEAKRRKAREAKHIKRAAAIEISKRVERTAYIAVFADEICDRISEGENLRDVLKDLDIKFTDMCRWLKREDFSMAYAAARENAAHLLISQVTHIADNARGKGEVEKIQIDARKWLATKILPHLYGDKVTHSGDKNNPVVTKLVADSEELIKQIRGEK